MNKIYYNWYDIQNQITDIAVQLWKSDWKPDYIVGIHNSGSIPAVMLGEMLSIKTHTLNVCLQSSFYDQDCESNCWMSEDAFGYNKDPKKILIIDSINDSGDTIKWIKEDWQASCLPNDIKWDAIWGNTVRVAVLVNNVSSQTDIDYHSIEINTNEKKCCIVFPWKEWYKNNTA